MRNWACQLSRINQCNDLGKQEMGRMQVRVPPGMVDLFCAGGSVDGTHGNGATGGEVGAVDVLANQVLGINTDGDAEQQMVTSELPVILMVQLKLLKLLRRLMGPLLPLIPLETSQMS